MRGSRRPAESGGWLRQKPCISVVITGSERRCRATTMAPRGANASTSTNSSAATSADATKDGQARQIFDQLDSNRDGTLSFDEFSRATFQQPAK